MNRADRTARRPPRQGGFALFAVLMLTLITTLVGLTWFAMAGYETSQAEYRRDYAQAFWAAETGLDRTVVWMQGLIQPPVTSQTPFRNQGVGDGQYDIEVIPDPNNATRAEKVFTVRSTGRAGRARRTIEEVVRLEGFARYGYFTNRELSPDGQVIWFVTGDDVGGRTHSNDSFHIAGSPHFRGDVTSSSDRMIAYPSTNIRRPEDWPSGSNNPVFDRGFTLGIPRIDLPVDTGNLLDAARNGGLALAGDYEFQFGRTAAGAFSYRPLAGGAWTDVTISNLGSAVVHVTGTARISGVLDGRLTLGTTRDIQLAGDMRYAAANATTGQPNAGCDDLLGLVAGQNVTVLDVVETRGDMIVDATVMALGTSFSAQNYSSGTPRGTLHLWGGLIQERRGPVGTFRGTTLQTGYLKDYHYDDRVTVQPPPQFPLTGLYARVSWREKAPIT